MNNTTIAERLSALRIKMNKRGIDLAIIPHVDPHQSEYMSTHWHLREFFSGFNGSAGTLVVSKNEALLWTDSRYFLQAEQQLQGTEIKLMKQALPGTPFIPIYICDHLKPGDTVGVDGMLFSINAAKELRQTLGEHGIKLVTDFNPASGIWLDRPELPRNQAFVYDIRYAGEKAESKINKMLDETAKAGADSLFVSALDEIAWVLNIRGNDVAYNPVVTAFLFLDRAGSWLFIDTPKISPELQEYLTDCNVSTLPYSSVKSFLTSLPADKKVLIDPSNTASAFAEMLGDRLKEAPSPIKLPKAIRNEVEIASIHDVMVRDGIALTRAMMDLEHHLAQGMKLTETGVAKLLSSHRGNQPLYVDDSFGTIAGYKEHGAIVHYEADEDSDATLSPEGLLLVDSGAQYLDGTTDITRTFALGEPTQEEKHDFTLVIKGHIALASAVFPEGTRGVQLDVLARLPLWKDGKTYLHGTGHGVGHFLNVHEGPQSIRMEENPVTLHAGMVISNEPGIYLTGKYGIRSENMILVIPAFTTEFGNFLKFETLTLFPFDLKLFDTSLMTDEEISWINEYHKVVYDKLSPLATDEEKEWLRARTLPLSH